MPSPMATPDSSVCSSDVYPRAWVSDTNADSSIQVKPRRPYTPYNLFYLLERELVVQGHEPSDAKTKALEKARATNAHNRQEDDIPIPERYKNVVLQPMWYEPNMKEKRKHRKTHGMISFQDLTAIISKNWATIDKETKDYCTSVSDLGRKRYKETMIQYNASQKIIQLSKERAAMEMARDQRMDQQFNPNSLGVSRSLPTTPDRTVFRSGSQIVTPPYSSTNYNHSSYATPIHVPSSGSYRPYGPPPPMPSSVHTGAARQPHSYSTTSQSHPWMSTTYQQQYNPSKPPNYQYTYHPAPAYNKTSDSNGGQAKKPSQNIYRTGPLNSKVGVADIVPSPCYDTIRPSETSSLTHNDALRLCNLMESPGKSPGMSPGKLMESPGKMYQYDMPLNDQVLRDMPSFDFVFSPGNDLYGEDSLFSDMM